MKKLSVVIPIYNVERYLNRCIKSVVETNYQNLEIILVDDGSKDNCPKICDEWADRDRRIKVIHKPNGGLVSARKAGLKIATGEFVTYVDGDDWVEAQIYDVLNLYDVDLIVEGFILDTENHCVKVKNKLGKGYYVDDNLKKICKNMILDKNREFILYPNVWNKIFRRKKLLRFQIDVPDSLTLGEDVAVTYRYLLDAKNMVVVDECYYHYIQNPNSMTKIKDIKYLEKSFVLFDYLSQFHERFGKQMIDYDCSMVVSGISILLDPRVRANNLYVKKMMKEYKQRDYLGMYVRNSLFFANNRILRNMIVSFENEKIAYTRYWVLIYIIRRHLNI